MRARRCDRVQRRRSVHGVRRDDGFHEPPLACGGGGEECRHHRTEGAPCARDLGLG